MRRNRSGKRGKRGHTEFLEMVPDTFSVPKFVLCVRNDDCDDLELRKVYEVLEDTAAAKEGYLRIVDDSSEDYLYPEQYFVRIALPLATGKEIGRAHV